jgi:hypothetical protein
MNEESREARTAIAAARSGLEPQAVAKRAKAADAAARHPRAK